MSLFHSLKSGTLIATAGLALAVLTAGSAMAQQCPEWQLNGIPITTDADTAWVPQQFPTYAGGAVDLTACPSVPGVGRVTAAPSFSLTYDARNMGRDLEFRVQSDCDTTLLINDASAQWHFNDDSDGTLSPRLRLANAISGRYDLWIGTFGGQSCQATLIAETFPGAGSVPPPPPPPPPAPVCPDWSLGGAELRLTAGQTEQRSVVAGGSISMFSNQCGYDAHGYVAQAPDFTLYFDPQGVVSTLDISVTGQCDETLLVNDPGTNWLFNDDSDSLHPRITIGDAVAGRYDIWVGTFGSSTCQATITVNASTPAPAPVAPPAPSK